MKEKILEALKKLDHSNPNHWTEDGLPRMDTMKLLVANPGLTREMINEASGGFVRDNPAIGRAPAAAGAGDPASLGGGSGEPAIAAPAAPQGPTALDETPVLTATPVADESDLESLRNRLADCDLRVEAASVALEAAKREQIAAWDEQSSIADQIQALDKASGGNPIREYLASQRRQNEIRAQHQERIRGVDLKAIADSVRGAPIDEAFAARRRVRKT